MRPSNKTWSLTVRRKTLHLDAPHGSFEVRGVSDDVKPVVQALPDGTDVECEGSFDGGGTVTHLVVTKVRRILKDLSGRVMELPHAIVAADGRLAVARARIHFAAGRIAEAARDVEALLRLGDDQAIGELERLPPEHREPLLEALVAWQTQRPASWRALRYLPLGRWTDAHIDQAVEQALASGGVFGAAPGVRAEDLLAELERRGVSTKSRAKQTQRLRRAQATEGDTFHRITVDVDEPRVIGADMAGVYVAGTRKLGESVEQVGARRQHSEDRRPVLVHYGLDGRELRRWIGLAVDRVVEGVALRLESPAECTGTRLSDGQQLYSFAHRIEHHDGELLWGIHARDYAAHTMHSEIRHIATGFTLGEFHDWIDDVVWTAQHILVYGESPQTLTREGKLVRASAPPPPDSLEIETASGRHRVPATHAPWCFGHWHSLDAGGWIVHDRGRQLFVAPSEPGAGWVHVELAKSPTHVDLAPPWLAIHTDGPIVLLALAEVMSASEIRIDGKRFARRSASDPRITIPRVFVDWFETLVDSGMIAPRLDSARDALLHRVFEHHERIPDDALARVLPGDSPLCIAHADHYVDADDQLFEELSQILDVDAIHVREVERHHDEGLQDAEDLDGEYVLVIEAKRGPKKVRRRSNWDVDAVMGTIDVMLALLGSTRRIYGVVPEQSHQRVFIVITQAQRQALVAAGVTGIFAGPRSLP